MSDEIEAQILETAARLFFEQGYAQTGINQLIDESRVAKRTFYRHFESKEALGVAYLERGAAQWLAGLSRAASGRTTPLERVRGLFRFLETFALKTEFRGCGMLNMAAEFADAGHHVRVRVREHKARERQLLRVLIDPRMDDATVDAVHVLLEGAIAAAAAHVDVWPIRAALRAAETLVGTGSRRARSSSKRPKVRAPSNSGM
jgi:AcrR family transcriptional regulator